MKLINISSENRICGTTSSFDLLIPKLFYNYSYVGLADIQLPTSYYLINSTNKHIGVTESDTTGTDGKYKLFTLTEGNYTVAELCTHIKAVLDAGTQYAITYACSSSAISGKITISTATADRAFYLNSTLTCSNETGLVSSYGIPTNYVPATPTTAFTLTAGELVYLVTSVSSTNHYNLAGSSYFTLLSTINRNGSYCSKNITANNIVAKIPNLQNTAHIIYYQPSEIFYFESQMIDGEVQHFELRDISGNLVDLNGLEFEFTLFLK